MTHYWDVHESKLVVCEAKVLASAVVKSELELKKNISLSKTMEEGPVSHRC